MAEQIAEQAPLHDQPQGTDAARLQAAPPQRICIVSDDLSGAPDEGIKKFTLAIAEALRAANEVTVISARGPATTATIQVVPAPRSFISAGLRAALRRQHPTLIIMPRAAPRPSSASCAPGCCDATAPRHGSSSLASQTRRHRPWQQRLLRHLQPDLIAVQSAANATYLANLGCRVSVVPSGVD